jgi:transcriptional regulator with XRE-family HTH domain
MKYDLKALGERIQRTRKEMKISQHEVAEHINRKREYISRIETGKTEPDLTDLVGMCDLFHCELGFLLGEPEYKAKTHAVTDICRVTGLSQKAVDNIISTYRTNTSVTYTDMSLEYGKLTITAKREPRRDFVNYFLENGLPEISNAVERLAADPDPDSDSVKLYSSLPPGVRSVIKQHTQLNIIDGGYIDDYILFIIDLMYLASTEEAGELVIGRCKEIAASDLFRTESEYINTTMNATHISKDYNTMIALKESVSRFYNTMIALKESDDPQQSIFFNVDEPPTEEDIQTVCRVAFVCGYRYTVKRLSEPIKQFELAEMFKRLVNDYKHPKRK